MAQILPPTMKAAAIDRFGDDLRLEQLPLPKVGPDEILIRVETAGVGVWDPFEREGGFARLTGSTPTFPYVLGSDGAGTVVAVGERVTGFKEGDRVYALSLATSRGFYAEYAPVKAEFAAPVPGRLPTEQAGAMPVDAITALRGLEVLQLKPGESILILGAGGGIGHLAVQLAKRMGARVLAVASGDDGVALVRRLGADAVVEGHGDDLAAAAGAFAPGGVDAALLTTGGEAARKALEVVRDGGRAAYPHGVEPEPRARSAIRIDAYDGDPSPESLRKLNQLIESGPFEVVVARTFRLDQAGEAHRALDQHYLGKLAIRPAAA